MSEKSQLNKAQREAVECTAGPLLVVAGAGAGKTRVITHRIAHLIETGIKPENILAVTFTNKAAGEMRERVGKLIGTGDPYQNQGVFVSTFHSLGVYMLRLSGRPLGISRWFTIYDRTESIRVIKGVMKEKGYDPKQFDPKGILHTISRNKGNFISEKEFAAESAGNYYFEIVSEVWSGYTKILEEQKALDFDDLLVKTVELLKKAPEVLKHYQSRWQYLHVDEYQDTNKVQYELIRLLAGGDKNLCVVGDEDQMIYGWRGANIRNILDFERDFTGATTVFLEENYRSTPTILTAANKVIRHNEQRKEKKLFTRNPEGDKLLIYEAFDGLDEARNLVDRSAKIISAGTKPEEIAVLYRANFQSRILEEAFLEAGVPYTILGTRFFERREIRDILAYAKAALNPEDRASISRVINVPKRGVGEKTLAKVFAGKLAEVPPGTRKKIEDFYARLSEFRKLLENKKTSEAIKEIIVRSSYEKMLMEGGEPEQERLENVRELVTLCKKYDVLPPEEGIEKLLTDSSLADDQDALTREADRKRGVRLMTVHAAKGLEFDYVFVVGLEQDLFPHTKMGEGVTPERLEEERRLFYVALTRARKRVFLSHASLRYIYGSQMVNVPSEFLSHIPNSLYETVTTRKQPENSFSNKNEGIDWDPSEGFLGNVIDIE